MNTYKIEVLYGNSSQLASYVVSFDRKPLVHEAWAWLKKKHGERSCYLNSNSVYVTEHSVEPFEVVI